MKKEIITKSAKETFKFGKKFAQKLKGGEIIALIGELGSGKTMFVQGVAAGLGIKEKITSPTFVLLKEYKTKISNFQSPISKLVHIDCYRMKNIEDVESIGIFDYFRRKDIVCLIEWADRIKKILPRDRIEIYFEHLGKDKRKIKIKISNS